MKNKIVEYFKTLPHRCMKSIKCFFSKENIGKNLTNVFLLVFGTLVLSVGSGFLLIPFGIVSGGITGITILLSPFIDPDICSLIITWLMFGLGLICLGFKFTISSLIATICYPLFLALILRTDVLPTFLNLIINPVGQEIIIDNGVIANLNELNIDIGLLLIIGILGGALVGTGCAITFHGGGSTGGLDILSFILAKFTKMKESVWFFICDGTIVTIGIIVNVVNQNHIMLVGSLVGIIAAFICSVMVEVIYSGQTSAYQVDVITNKYTDIVDFAINDLDRGATIFDVVGAYSGEEKKMVRIAFSRREYTKITTGIDKIDPKAFCTFSQTLFVGGQGFDKVRNNEPIKVIKKTDIDVNNKETIDEKFVEEK